MKKQTLQERSLTELLKLKEATRTQLVSQSRNVDKYKDQSRGATRLERKKYSKVVNQVKSFNSIDMNKFWKQDILEVDIPIVGETDEYIVKIKLEGVVAEIQKNVKNNQNKFEFKTVIQAITKIFNTSDVYTKCTCPDFKYRFAHWAIVNNYSIDDSAHDPGPGKGIVNPKDSKGRGCKHILLVLSNGNWMMKVASVVVNYTHYLSEKKPDLFLKLIFPKLYNMPAEEAAENDLVENNEDLETGKDLIDVVNEWAKTRGRFKKGSNANPVTGTGGKKKAKEPKDVSEENDKAEEEPADTEDNKNTE